MPLQVLIALVQTLVQVVRFTQVYQRTRFIPNSIVRPHAKLPTVVAGRSGRPCDVADGANVGVAAAAGTRWVEERYAHQVIFDFVNAGVNALAFVEPLEIVHAKSVRGYIGEGTVVDGMGRFVGRPVLAWAIG